MNTHSISVKNVTAIIAGAAIVLNFCANLFLLHRASFLVRSAVVFPHGTGAAYTQDMESAAYPSDAVNSVVNLTAKNSVIGKKLIYPDYPYFIEVDKTNQVITVYTTSFSGKYDRVARQMICSTAENKDKFPDGYWKLKASRSSAKNIWRTMKSHGKPLYAQWATQITGDFLFHSVPYTATKKTALDTARYRKLGTADSGGCIRLTVEDAKWICQNCKAGTTVHMVSKKSDPELVARMKAEVPALDNSGWDPTDPDPKNPNYHPVHTQPTPETQGFLVDNREKIKYSAEIPYVS